MKAYLELSHYLSLGLNFPLDKRNITYNLKILDRPSHLTSTINQVWVAKTSRRYGGPRLLKIKSVIHRAYS